VLAAVVDLFITICVSLLLLPSLWEGMANERGPNPFQGGWYLTIILVGGFPYYTLSEIVFGRTIGKALLGLKVQTRSPAKAIRLRALIRNVARVLLWGFPILGSWVLIAELLLVCSGRHLSLLDRIACPAVVDSSALATGAPSASPRPE